MPGPGTPSGPWPRRCFCRVPSPDGRGFKKPVPAFAGSEGTLAEIKGAPLRIFGLTPRSANGLSDLALDCRLANAVHVEVYVSGATPSATITIEGASESGGNFQTLPDPNATQAAVATDDSFDVNVGSAWVRVRIASISGTFTAGQGYIVIVTPYVAAGQNQINVTNTASQNLAQYNGSTVGAGNAVHVQAGTAATWDVSDRAARDNGLVRVSQATPGTTNLVESRPSSRRNGGALHRDAITAVDKLAAPAAPSSLSDITTGGSLLANSTYYVTASAYNRWGVTTVPAAVNQATAADASNTHIVQFSLAQVASAVGYDIFLSTDAAPRWVARITEAQRAAADGVVVTGVGTVTAGAALGAGVIQVQVAGTGIQSNAIRFASNSAYRPDNGSIVAVSCAGRTKAVLLVKLGLTDERTAPSLALLPFFANQVSADDWAQGERIVVPMAGDLAGQGLIHSIPIDVYGSTGVKILLDAINGTGAACTVHVELV